MDLNSELSTGLLRGGGVVGPLSSKRLLKGLFLPFPWPSLSNLRPVGSFAKLQILYLHFFLLVATLMFLLLFFSSFLLSDSGWIYEIQQRTLKEWINFRNNFQFCQEDTIPNYFFFHFQYYPFQQDHYRNSFELFVEIWMFFLRKRDQLGNSDHGSEVL